jgi:hypothetical protein
MKNRDNFLLVFTVLSVLFSFFVVKVGPWMTILGFCLFLALCFMSLLLTNMKSAQKKIFGFPIPLLIFLLILLFYTIGIFLNDVRGIGEQVDQGYSFLLSFNLFLSFIMGIIIGFPKKGGIK